MRTLGPTNLSASPLRNFPLEAVLRHTEDRDVIRDSQYDFTKGKPCLTHMMAFYDKVTISVEKGKVTDVIYRDLCKALTQSPTKILLSKLERVGFDR